MSGRITLFSAATGVETRVKSSRDLNAAEFIPVLVDLENRVGDIVHVPGIAEKRTGGPDHDHFLADPVAVRTCQSLSIRLQLRLSILLPVEFLTQDIADPWLTMQTLLDVGTQTHSFGFNCFEKAGAIGPGKVLLIVGCPVEIE
jgi:hypothetical protein